MPDTAKPAAAKPSAGRAPRPARHATAAYAAAVYAFFLAVFAYTIGFFANAPVPRSIDHGPGSSWPFAAGIDVLLLRCSLAARARCHLRDQPRRPVRAAAGVRARPGRARGGTPKVTTQLEETG